MKTKKNARGKSFLFISFRGEHKPLGVLYVPRGEPQVRTLRPRQPEQAAHQAYSAISAFFISEDLGIFKSVLAPAFQCRQNIIEFWYR
jgi:hypothetical protein